MQGDSVWISFAYAGRSMHYPLKVALCCCNVCSTIHGIVYMYVKNKLMRK